MTKECPNCGADLTSRYVRVFSDNDGNLDSCYQCGGKFGRHAGPNAKTERRAETAGTTEFEHL